MLCVRDVLHPYLILNGEQEEEDDGRASASMCVAQIAVVFIPVAPTAMRCPSFCTCIALKTDKHSINEALAHHCQ